MATKHTITVFPRGIECDVEYHYTPRFKGDRETPDEPAYVEIETIRIAGEDMTDYLTEAFQELVEDAVYENHGE